jgi:hypothetical protein
MSDITLITAPDKLYSQEFSFLLIYPSAKVKDEFQTLISEFQEPFHVYLYEKDDEVEWLLDVFNMVDIVIMDIDHCPSRIRDLTSYFISKSKTYWLTKSGENYYNVISKNRIFGLDYLKDVIGGRIEATR